MRQLAWAVCLGIVLMSPLAWAETTHVPAGPVSGDWTEKGSPYVIEGDVVVPEGQTLTIDQNVNVTFAGHYRFVVNGTLKAITDKNRKHHSGNSKYEEKAIHFTSDSAANPAGWGGIRFVNASKDCRLSGCVIENGHATGTGADAMGGGVYCENSTVTIENTVIRHNSAEDFGGGLAMVNSSVSVANGAFSDNSAGKAGGGIYASGGTLDIANAAVEKNFGGGISVSSTELNLANAAVQRNRNSGITMLNHSKVSIANCAVSENSGAERGGGIFCLGSSLDMANGAISKNENGGLFCGEASEVSLVNCAIGGNRGGKNVERDDGTKFSALNSAVKD